MNETTSLKSLAFNALQRLERNKPRNKTETNVQNLVSRPAPCETNYETKNRGIPLDVLNTSPDTFDQYRAFSFRADFEERIAIAEYDGSQKPIQAQRIAYLDAFISVLLSLTETDPYKDWLSQQIQTALAILETQDFPTLN